MYAIRYHESGSPDVLQYESIDRPEPGSGEVLVEVRAAAVNPVDAKRRATQNPPAPKTTGSDLAGVVVEVGEAVDQYSPGDRVFATGLHNTRFTGGSFAEFTAVPTDLLAHLPEPISFEAGAAVALVGVTAWRALVDHAALVPGSTVFVHGGNGGVGHVAVSLASAMGARVGCTARPTYHESLRDLGATHTFDYRREDLLETVQDTMGSADAILDHMPETYLEFDVGLAAFDGDVVLIAGSTTTVANLSLGRAKELTVHSMGMSNLVKRPELPTVASILERLATLLVDGRLDVIVDRHYPLEDGADAHEAVMNESVLGKILVRP